MKKGPLLDVTSSPVATPPYVSFLPHSVPPLHWCCMSVWHVWENVTSSRPRRLSEKHNHCSPLVFTRIEFPFSKATWGFSCVFAPIVLILVSLCLLLFRDPLFHADVTDSFDQRSAKNVGWWPLHPIWILSCFHPGSPSLNVLFSLVECTASNYSLVEILVKLFWRWNCHELSCGNIHVAGVDGYDVGATVEDDRDFWVKEFIRWLYAASYRDHQLRYEIFFSVHSADSFFQKWKIVGDLRVIHSVHIVPAADYKIIIFSLSVKYSHARTTI